MMKIEKVIERFIPDKDQFIEGYAEMEQLLHSHHKFNYAVSAARKMDDAKIDGIENGQKSEYYLLYT